MSRYSPWDDLASRPELTFGVTDLPEGAGEAWWLPEVPGIVMRRGLTQVERRCALAHELVHVDREDRPRHTVGPDGPRLARRQEMAADDIAAARLIPLDRLADALQWSFSPDEVAEELGVTPKMARIRILGLSADEKAWIDQRLRCKEESA